jgi:hypothetical protein
MATITGRFFASARGVHTFTASQSIVHPSNPCSRPKLGMHGFVLRDRRGGIGVKLIRCESRCDPGLFARLGRSGFSVGGVGRKDDVGFAEGLVLHDHKGCQDLTCWAEMKHLARQ